MNSQKKGTQKVKIRVMIVEDHPLFQAGLLRALEFEDDIAIVATAENGSVALELARTKPLDIILMDINLPGKNGLQITRELRQQRTTAGIIILTAHHDDEQVLHAVRSGASAYCAKDIRPQQLIRIIKDVAQGYYYINDERMTGQQFQNWLDESLEDSAGSGSDNKLLSPLSRREMQILEYVTHGLINKEIAAKLGISQQTVKNHMTSILKKLNVNDRTQAAVTALRRGWVRINDDSHQEA